jgi:mono/diheme cytochrome c family protein
MADQPSVQPYEEPAGWPVPGTVAVDQEFGVASLPDPNDADVANPLANEPGVAAAGKVAYRRYCWQCHGARLDGVSTVGPSFPRGQLDLTDANVTDQPDGMLFWKTLNGFGNMPPLAATMTHREAWQVIAYLRAETAGKRP